jgi:hypothetical protein
MLDRGDNVVEDDSRYKEKSMASGSSMRAGIGPVDLRAIGFESLYRGDVGSDGGDTCMSASLQICEQNGVPFVCLSQDRQKSPKHSMTICVSGSDTGSHLLARRSSVVI